MSISSLISRLHNGLIWIYCIFIILICSIMPTGLFFTGMLLYIKLIYKPNLYQDHSKPSSWPVFVCKKTFHDILIQLSSLFISIPNQVFDDFFGLHRANIMYVICKLNISDKLVKKAMNIQDLCKEIHAKKPELIKRFLLNAQSLGYFQQDDKGLWHNTSKSQILSTYHPNSIKYLLQHFKEELYEPFGRLLHSIQDDEAVFEKVYGMNVYKYFEKHPQQEENFGLGMTALDALDWYSQCHDFSWDNYDRIVDIGGSFGSLLSKIMITYPKVKGVLFDRPPVIEKAKHYWNVQHTDLHHRIVMTGGTFFLAGTLPVIHDGDCILLRQVLQDWPDEQARLILYNLRSAIGSKNVVLSIVECCPSERDMAIRHMMDIHLRVVLHGVLRYISDMELLFAQTGFRLAGVVETRSMYKILVVLPV